ncbi:MFS general substrate transporter [Crepidotus variabilis]|uniref:MFS general substrate transporter n=1 Tax=Crepidotus variabilis TaxID=179855 RepID=A0A9P6JJ73_9AGAR|nr:MFS general substrate transporter [Crepidotus variabilis]
MTNNATIPSSLNESEKYVPEKQTSVHVTSTVNSRNTSIENLYEDGVLDPVYYAKTLVLNKAIQEIGMGKYQYKLLIVAGFGWFADSVWPLLTGLILQPVVNEFGFNPPFLSLAANAGLLVGAIFWGLGCDVWGRKWCFNITLFLAGVFGLSAGGAPNFVALASLMAVMGVGVGGNLPVDSAVFLDLIPASHQYLLTFMSIFWCLGQLFVNLIAWPLIANFSCSPALTTICSRSDNMGWRYLLFILGGITLLLWGIRFFLFDLLESPRYLDGRGQDAEAVEVIQRIAKYNGRDIKLTVDDLAALGEIGRGDEILDHGEKKRGLLTRTSNFRSEHVKALFRTPKIAWSTSLLIALWGIIGLASTLYNSFLPYLLITRGTHFGDASLNTTYRNTLIISVVGLPSALLATLAVEIPGVGRKGTLAISAGLTGTFLLASTTARSSNALLGWNCGYAFFSNIMYGVLYALSPEIFPAKDRGTGNGLVSTATRVFGLIAPIIALYANITTEVPVYIAGAMVIFSGGIAMILPYEPRGKASM